MAHAEPQTTRAGKRVYRLGLHPAMRALVDCQVVRIDIAVLLLRSNFAFPPFLEEWVCVVVSRLLCPK